MKVILKEKVPHLGNIGEIVKVSAGYGRNFLLAQNMAVLADERNQNILNNEKKRLATKMSQAKNAALELKKKIDGITLELVKKVGSNSKLFGSVTTLELAKLLQEKHDIEIERRLIILGSPIKSTGSFVVTVKLFHEVEAKFTVKVAMDPVQAEELKKKQEAALKKAKSKKAVSAEQEEANTESIGSDGELSAEESKDVEVETTVEKE